MSKLLLIVFSILFFGNSYGIQLGNINVTSNQNSLFDAEIKVTLNQGEDIKKMNVSIASEEMYTSQGMQRKPIHSDMSIAFIDTNIDDIKLALKSTKPVKESFIDLLLQIESPKGKIFKEYTVLLDAPLPSSKQNISNNEPTKIKTKTRIAKSNNSSKNSLSLVTKSGKTLFQIARENSISGITTEQYAVAVFQLNPKAFAKSNINGLIKGQKIILPEKDFFENLSHLKARKILREQNLSWNKATVKVSQKNIKETKKESNNYLQEINKLKAEIEKLNKALAEQKNLTKQIDSDKTEVKSNTPESSQPKKALDKKNDLDSLKDSIQVEEEIAEIDEQTFISSIAVDDDVIIEEVVIDDIVESKANKSSGVIYLVILLFLTLGGFLIFLLKKRSKLETPFNKDLKRTSVDQYIHRKIIEKRNLR